MTMTSRFLDGLNTAQKEAVLHKEGPLLIVAGAGAGKTKTITHRIAQLIESGVPARTILAVTFTNKAAGEMRERVARLLRGRAGATPLIATFHSLGVRLLREFHREAGIPRGFSIWDQDDSTRAVKNILKQLDTEEWTPRQILSAISREKGAGTSVREYRERAGTRREQTVALVWDRYEQALRAEDGLDFDDLLVRTLTLLRESPKTLSLLQNRWHYLTVDEYQDTSGVQYEMMRLLCGEKNNICVVGDLDQCLVAGTKITMADGTEKPIESVRAGDLALSNHGSGHLRATRVIRSRKRSFTGNLVALTFKSGKKLVSTPEHIHFAGYKLGIVPQSYFTYLMYKRGFGWRIGVSKVYTNGQQMPMIGFQLRCNQEHADKVWIIATHATPNEARVFEYITSLEYKIPTIPFVARKGLSVNGYVHDQRAISAVFEHFDTETSARALLEARGLAYEYPHHRAQATTGGRRNIVVTLCGSQRKLTPMHRIAIAASEPTDKRALESIGLSVRPAKKNDLDNWRFESAYKDYGELREIVHKIQTVLPHAEVVETARLGGNKKRPKDGNSLPYLPASSVLPGMAVFDAKNNYDIVEKVERIPAKKSMVYDLDIENTHNFIANGIVTHNCIYTWRQAEIRNLLSFERAFPKVTVVRLEQNYRSTRTILAAANSVIEKNVNRIPKTLFSENDTGEPITLYGAMNERDEAWFVVEQAAALMDPSSAPPSHEASGGRGKASEGKHGVPANEIAILYRENAQSRVLEEAFLHAGLPYRVLGTRFFERKEVKDVLSYLRAALNPKSRSDLARIVAVPPRGIGKVTLEKMFTPLEVAPALARPQGLWGGLLLTGLAGSTRVKVESFINSLAKIRHAVNTLPASEAVKFCIEESGIQKMFVSKTEEGREHLGNVRELANLAAKYENEEPPAGIEKLLEEAALQSEQDELDLEREKSGVSLMTVHAAKGLEFDAVFIVGLEQGLFPSLRNDADRDPEEERRLFYVALTRARKHLFLSYAAERSKYGTRESAMPSEFLSDIDERLMASPHAENSEREDIID
ncbi:MAG: 3'-5' exonuclease [bacterium]|nr:3'-5' exonuclease [bacterium]